MGRSSPVSSNGYRPVQVVEVDGVEVELSSADEAEGEERGSEVRALSWTCWGLHLLPLCLLLVLVQVAVNAAVLLLQPQTPSSSLSSNSSAPISPLSPLSCPASRSSLMCGVKEERPLTSSPDPNAPFMRWATEHAPLQLSCADGGRVRVVGATWGYLCGWHPSTGLGAGCPWTSFMSDSESPPPLTPPPPPHSPPLTCRLLHLTEAFQRLCNGRTSCTIEHARLSGPLNACPSYPKKVVASWTCGPAMDAASPSEPRTLPDLNAALTEAGEGVQGSAVVVSPSSSSSSSPRHCELVISSQVNITGFGPWMGGGLWNQLVNVQQMAALAWSSSCNLSVTAFLPDYNAPTEVRFGSVFDLSEMNRILCPAHFLALSHPSTSFFKQSAPHCPSSLSPFHVTDSLQPGGWPGWEGTESVEMETLKKTSINNNWMSLYYDTLARTLQSHPDPGSLWLRGGWDGWAGFEQTLPGLAVLRGYFVDSIRFTAPFIDSVAALQRLMGVEGSGRFTFIHFRLEEDLLVFARGTSMTVEQYTDRMYEQLMAAFDSMVSLDRPAGSAELERAQRIRAWPVYLGTGLLYSSPYVARAQGRHPWATFYTKDLFLYEHCGLPRPSNAPPKGDEAAQRRWVEAVKRLPWTAGVNECTLLLNSVKGESALPNREYWAILDWQLTREVSHFMGPTKSSFTVNTVAAIDRNPKLFHTPLTPSHNATYTQFAWGLPVEF